MIRRAAALLPAAGALLSEPRADGFPHARHAGLFPTCLGCHRGIPTGDEDRYYSVTPRECVRCHDGDIVRTVDWAGPTRTPSNLVFVHARHIAEVERAGDDALSCADCHGPLEPGRPRMQVARAAPSTCVGCHAHTAPEHLAAGASCSTCHAPLAETTDLSVERIAAFPKPPSHGSPDFLFEHGRIEGTAEASCAVCHARQSCARCHLNADALPRVQALPSDPRVAELASDEAPEWPTPASHRRAGWDFSHGAEAVSGSRDCANCHAETSCRMCHGDADIPVIAALPEPGVGQPAGVRIARTRPPGHTAGFATAHGSAAAADIPNCSSCHLESQCADCHAASGSVATGFTPRGAGARSTGSGDRGAVPPTDAAVLRHLAPAPDTPDEGRPGYHPANFLLRHGAEAFSVQTVCSDCHSTEAFCRDCHASSGVSIGAGGGAGGAFHDAQPNWLFEHGRAARQGMESCASCHQQTSCLRCHSAKFGLRISPHGPGFDAERLAARSTMSCGVCHTADQIPPP